LTANPNPIPVTGGSIVGQTTISWSAPDAQVVEIHTGSPSGALFTDQGNRGSIQTGTWVSNGMTFYLQDVTGGKPLTSDYTLATLVVNLQTSTANGAALGHFGGGANWWAAGAAIVLIGLSLAWAWMAPQRKRLPLALGGAVLLAGLIVSSAATNANGQSQAPTAEQTAATLDRMIAAHKDQEQIAQYVFNTHGCKSCHVLGQNGKLGFTSRGQEVGKDFEGCIRLLTDMNHIVKVPDAGRSDQERHKAARFQEFGCTFCHNVGKDKVGMTELGAKLSNLHLGCVDIEKQLANGSPPRR